MRRARPDDTEDTKRTQFRRCVKELQLQHQIGVEGNFVWAIYERQN